jgi:hypothetical protein
MKRIKDLPDDEKRLDAFAILFARTLDLIATAVSQKKTIPHEFFEIRSHFVDEI